MQDANTSTINQLDEIEEDLTNTQSAIELAAAPAMEETSGQEADSGHKEIHYLPETVIISNLILENEPGSEEGGEEEIVFRNRSTSTD